VENSLDSLWTQVLDRLEKKLSQPTFETWIKTAMAIDLKENCLILETPNLFARNWLQANYINIITCIHYNWLGRSYLLQALSP